MNKRLPIISIIVLLAAAIPCVSEASPLELVALEQVDERVEINVDGQTVYITGAQGEDFVVVSLTGRQLLKVKIDSPSQRIELNVPKGCYILKVGKVVRKIQVR